MTRWPQHAPRDPRSWRGIKGLPVALALVQVFGSRAAAGGELPPPAYLLLLAGPGALLLRRRWPVVTLVVAVGATVAYLLRGYPAGPFMLAALAAVISAVRLGRRTAAWLVTQLGVLTYLVLGWFFADLLRVPEPARPTLARTVGIIVATVLILAFAEAMRARSEELTQLARIRAEQERARGEQQRRQASEERLRIARELHDVLGHHLSLINVRAGVGLHLMDTRPEQAREALAAIKSASAEALREVRSVLGVLRPEDEAAPRAPAPSLDRLDDLTGAAGIPVSTHIRGTPRPVPAEVDRAAYRIVQESLTNVRRHAGPRATATVIILYADDALNLTVRDDGFGASDTVPEDGNGLAGMRARAAALGGELTAGPMPAGGFEVTARLPERVPSGPLPGEIM